jgi:hypothetical protein
MPQRQFVKQVQPLVSMNSTIDPADFVPVIDNPFFTLQPGTTFTTESEDGSRVDTFVVTRRTIDILGVSCVVVVDTATVDGELAEKTFDYFAQDKDGNVWYFGEDTKEFEDGKVVSTEGTWRAGVDGAEPGFIMLAAPAVGNEYDQENAPDVAEDHALVVSVDQTASVPYGDFDDVLHTMESTPLDPGVEFKFYAPGVGFVQAVDKLTGEIVEQLVQITVDGTAHDDKLHGYAGGDEVNGKSGDDDLNGLAGADTVHGGFGRDTVEGGNDGDADVLCGDNGNDVLHVRTADEAFGGNGNDLFRLFDNDGFGAIDGGEQVRENLAKTRGDVLQFDGLLDLTTPGLSERITDIETLSMKDVQGNDVLSLAAEDVLELGDGEFNPKFHGKDQFPEGSAVRVDGDSGDQLALAGDWTEIAPRNAPDDYRVFASLDPAGNAYVLVQDDIVVNLVA